MKLVFKLLQWGGDLVLLNSTLKESLEKTLNHHRIHYLKSPYYLLKLIKFRINFHFLFPGTVSSEEISRIII